jgi:hypothetical protein
MRMNIDDYWSVKIKDEGRRAKGKSISFALRLLPLVFRLYLVKSVLSEFYFYDIKGIFKGL